MHWIEQEIERVTSGETTCLDLRARDPTGRPLTTFPRVILQLSQLTELDLSGHLITSIPRDIVCLQNLRRLNLAWNRTMSLPENFNELTHLEFLDLSGTDVFRNLSEPVLLPASLKCLKLADIPARIQLDRVLDALRGCSALQELDLANTYRAPLEPLSAVVPDLKALSVGGPSYVCDDLRSLAKLKSLVALTLRARQVSLSELKEIAYLERLELVLDVGPDRLSAEMLARDKGVFEELRFLRHLRVRVVQIDGESNAAMGSVVELDMTDRLFSLDLARGLLPTDFPSWLLRAQRLKSLALQTYDLESIPTQLFALRQLSELALVNCNIKTVPAAIRHLSELTFLNLSGNPIRKLPIDIGGLRNLRSLRLANTLLQSLPDTVSDLSALKTLSLQGTSIDRCPEVIFSLGQLRRLDLSGTGIRFLPKSLGKLQCLESLNVSQTLIRQLPRAIADLRLLKELKLDTNSMLQPPPEIISRGLAAVQGYFRALSEETTRLLEAKLIIVGEGEVGKTSIAIKLMNPRFDLASNQERVASTRGIAIGRWFLRTSSQTNFTVNIWDFGGQEIYHATHQFFLTRRSLYIFVWDATKEDRLAGFDYWLSIVRLLSASSPILVVLNKADRRIKEVDQKSLSEKFPNIVGFHKVSALFGTGIQGLTLDIRRVLASLPHVGDLWPTRWSAVRKVLESNSREYIDTDEYLAICNKEGLNEEQALLLSNYLHDLGVILHFHEDPLLQRIVVLKPEWGTDAVYAVLDTKSVQQNHGRFSLEDLRTIWSRSRYPVARHPELLQLMVRFELCFRLENSINYVAPELLAEAAPNFPWDSTANLRFEYRYEFMPAGILTRFIARMHSSIERNYYWKNGLVLKLHDARAYVIAEPLNRKIRVAVDGRSPKDALAIIRHEMTQIHRTLNDPDVAEMIPCVCEQCQVDDPFFFAHQLLRQYLTRGLRTVVCERSFKSVLVSTLLTGILRPLEMRDVLQDTVRQDGQGAPSVVINNIIGGTSVKASSGKEVGNVRSPWASGSFYLCLLAMVLSMLGAAAHLFSPIIVLVIILGGTVLTTVVGALQLKHDHRVKDATFVKLMALAFRQLPLLRNLRGARGRREVLEEEST